MYKFLAILIFLSFYTPVNASEARWQANCDVLGTKMQLSFASKSGDAYEDDMRATIAWNGGAAKPVALPAGLYLAGEMKMMETKSSNQCDKLTGLFTPFDNFVVFFRRDDRPGPDRRMAILINRKTGQVMDIADLGEESHESLLKEDYKGGVRIRLIQKWQRLSFEPKPVYGWLLVQEHKGKLVKRWVENK